MSQPARRELWQSSATSEGFCCCYRITGSPRLDKPSCPCSPLSPRPEPRGVPGTPPGVGKAEWHRPRTTKTRKNTALKWSNELRCSDTIPNLFLNCSASVFFYFYMVKQVLTSLVDGWGKEKLCHFFREDKHHGLETSGTQLYSLLPPDSLELRWQGRERIGAGRSSLSALPPRPPVHHQRICTISASI